MVNFICIHNLKSKNMKKVIMMAGLSLIMLASCKKKEDPAPVTPPPVEEPAPEPTPQPQTNNTTSTSTTTTTTTKAEEEPDGTSVSIGKDGVSIQSKDGEKKNNVTITNQKKEVEIKTKN